MSGYTFTKIENCNMCGATANYFNILGRRLNGSQGKSPHKKMGLSTTISKCKNCKLI